QVMAPNAGGEPTGDLLDAIKKEFGSFESFQEQFSKAAATRFGSGWAWLSWCKNQKKLFVCSTANQDNTLMEGAAPHKGIPLLGLDVWEHAYYLNYQNRRPDYVKAWWNVVNWKQVDQNWKAACGC
ncbi:MAG: superoxide dismutase, partial [Deltaproteobacteria bacterium CG_4_10_14_0_2_um_filter_43_8]